MKTSFSYYYLLIALFGESDFICANNSNEKGFGKVLLANYYENKFSSAPKNDPTNQAELKQKANDYLAAQPVKFLENKGQMIDINSKPVPFVLFKAEAPGMNVYITEKGLTYVFVKAEEDSKNL